MRLGPITITSTRKWRAYHHLANVTMFLHQFIWYCEPDDPQAIRQAKVLDAPVSDALSRVDPPD